MGKPCCRVSEYSCRFSEVIQVLLDFILVGFSDRERKAQMLKNRVATSKPPAILEALADVVTP